MIEVFVKAIASLTQHYDQPLRCFTFVDFQLVPTVEEFYEILGCPLEGRKPYLFSGFYPSMARITKVKVVRICRSKASRIILMMPRNYKDHSRMKKARFQAKAKVSRKELR